MAKILEERKNKENVFEEMYIEKILRQNAASILKDSRRAMRGFSQSKWRNVKMIVDKNTMTYEHLAVHRYNDMKTRKSKRGTHKKKNYPIHNKVIMTHKRFLIRQLSFGFTDEVKRQFQNLENSANNLD